MITVIEWKYSWLWTCNISVLHLSTNRSLNEMLNKWFLIITWHNKFPPIPMTIGMIKSTKLVQYYVKLWHSDVIVTHDVLKRLNQIGFVHVIKYIATWCGSWVAQRVILRIMPPQDNNHRTHIIQNTYYIVPTQEGCIRPLRSQHQSFGERGTFVSQAHVL